jgi:hypothetical protein
VTAKGPERIECAVEVAKYLLANQIDEEPAFDWWAKAVLKMKKRPIKVSRAAHRRQGYKFGVRIPNNMAEALQIDLARGDTLWKNAIDKEMTDNRIAFDIQCPDVRQPPGGYQIIPLRMVFDVKMDFRRTARLVAGGHVTNAPDSITYASVVSNESVGIAFTLATIFGLDVMMTDIKMLTYMHHVLKKWRHGLEWSLENFTED